MTKKLLFIILLNISSLNAQIQISNFTYNNVQQGSPAHLQEVNGEIYFTAKSDNYGRELWSSNGTLNNTNLIFDVVSGTSDGFVNFYSSKLNNELIFVANNDFDYSGFEIWKTDGTNTGTTLITNFNGRLFGLTTVGNNVFIVTKTDANSNIQIWKTDGTNTGTILVKETATSSVPTYQGSLNGLFVFTQQAPSLNFVNVWSSDGTDSGTFTITGDLDGNGNNGSTFELSQYIKFNNKLYFVTRYHLYETDGTINGTNIVANVWNAQNNLVSFGDSFEINNKMYFSFFSKDLKKLSIYESDGTNSGTSEIYTVTSSNYFYPSYLNKIGDNLIFTSVNSNMGTSIFYLNTNNNNVSEIVEIDQNPSEPFASFLGPASALSLRVFDNGNLFDIDSPDDIWPNRNGWIYDLSQDNLISFDEIARFGESDLKIIYNDELYYSYNFQLWKFDLNSLSNNSFDSNKTINIFPNPTSDYINFNGSEDFTQIEIYDINGKLVSKSEIFETNFINVKELKSGTYFIRIISRDNKITTKKIIKK